MIVNLKPYPVTKDFDIPWLCDALYSVKTGYEVSFTRYFYKPQPLRTLADILALQQETEGLLVEIIGNERQH